MLNHPVMTKTLNQKTHESIAVHEPNVIEILFYVIYSLTRDHVPVVQPDVFGFGVVGGWGFQLKFFPTPKPTNKAITSCCFSNIFFTIKSMEFKMKIKRNIKWVN